MTQLKTTKEVLQDAEIYPTWTCGDSLNIDTIAKGYEADLLFSCPPYTDLEVYSDAKEDISNMPYKEFLSVYREIIRKSCNLLKNDRFEEKPLNERLMKSILSLHTGEYFGFVGKVGMFIASLLMSLFTITGFMLYINRRNKKKQKVSKE